MTFDGQIGVRLAPALFHLAEIKHADGKSPVGLSVRQAGQ
jgi:hypothetical protein